MIDYLNDLFYGDYWFIYWGIISFLFAVGLAFQLPAVVKAIKEKRKK
ncbi:MAG: hypothetical protein NC078_04965 [Ruminococcus sp.]|nr:hypothetical protein [Ruminococcus sp.]